LTIRPTIALGDFREFNRARATPHGASAARFARSQDIACPPAAEGRRNAAGCAHTYTEASALTVTIIGCRLAGRRSRARCCEYPQVEASSREVSLPPPPQTPQ
jgi:hypothetical protein